jgi:formylglycine-generating enzyme required for sulfatase activity
MLEFAASGQPMSDQVKIRRWAGPARLVAAAGLILLSPIAGGASSTPVQPLDSQMVAIPAGPFIMGNSGEDLPEALPRHQVTLSAYSIDAHEVTNVEYRACESAGACTAPTSISSNTRSNYHTNAAFDAYPVINVSWAQASAYCVWAGKRLPTEAEWEKAARGGCEVVAPASCGAEDARSFPWGEAAASCTLANFRPYPAPYCVSGGDTDAIGTHPSGDSPYGVHDMAGNVAEWVADWYNSYTYSRCSGTCTDPPGAPTGTERVARGGSWADSAGYLLRVGVRSLDTPTIQSNQLGFRCAKTP